MTETTAFHPHHWWRFALVIIVMNLIRLIGLEASPPGFYVDEAVGAGHVVCMHQTGADLWGNSFPLFSRAWGVGYTTPTYLYGEYLWTGLFGNSIQAFRSFIAFLNVMAIFFLFDWLRKRANLKIAYYAAILASFSPWGFLSSRIAWDPPVAPFFIIFGLWLFDVKKAYGWVLGALAFGLAAYSYPPTRIQMVILLFFLPGKTVREKIKIFAVFAASNIPMLYQTLTDPTFLARAKLMALTSSYQGNPYRDDHFFALVIDFLNNFIQHFTPNFLVFHGDHKLHNSIQDFGMLSYPEVICCLLGLGYFFIQKIRRRVIPLQSLFLFALVAVASGIAPAALTWEEIPHGLRAIGAWPFFSMVGGIGFYFIVQSLASLNRQKILNGVLLASCVCFGAFYLTDFFQDYPAKAASWYQDDNTPIGSAYRYMTQNGSFCADLEIRHQRR